MSDLVVALALAVAIEGALCALFPDGMRRTMKLVLAQPADRVRMVGLVAAAAGVCVIWLVRSG